MEVLERGSGVVILFFFFKYQFTITKLEKKQNFVPHSKQIHEALNEIEMVKII